MHIKTLALSILLSFLIPSAQGEVRVDFDDQQNVWTLKNELIAAVFRLNSSQSFALQQITDLRTGYSWAAPAERLTSPVSFGVDGTRFDADTAFRLVSQNRSAVKNGYRQSIVLEDLAGLGQVQVNLEIYENQPVLRYGVRFKNLSPQTVHVDFADMLPWSFADNGQSYRLLRVTQWVVDWDPGHFQPIDTLLESDGFPVIMTSGAHGQYCAWLAIQDTLNRGIFAGWEFDGRAAFAAQHVGSGGYFWLGAKVLGLAHPVPPNDEFEIPSAFIGLYSGDWDEAAYRTQRFAEAVLAAPPPEPQKFPYVGWDSWAYGTQIDERTLRNNAKIAANLGMEIFIVDLGWSRSIGDWVEDPAKFPSGLRALSDYVHSLGMKFGLHFALAEADPDSPVLREHPDWTSSVSYGYYGALSLCLSNQPAKEWLIQQAVRMIDDYNVDWILQDGENMVKECTKTTHTHDPGDSNYSNSVEGLNAVVAAVQQQRPKVVWENCEDGGNMMTFSMIRRYVTSITNDASGASDSRKAAYGVTYPFPPRYAERYMLEDRLDSYTTRSYMFGGPWHFMNRLVEMSPGDLELAAQEIETYKKLRQGVGKGKVFHLTRPPGEKRIDAIQSYDPVADASVAIVTRDEAPASTFELRLKGLAPANVYEIRFAGDPRILRMTGRQLMTSGVEVRLPEIRSAEIVYAGAVGQ